MVTLVNGDVPDGLAGSVVKRFVDPDDGHGRERATPVTARRRLRIAQDLDANLMVVAGAGTGKTTALVGRIVALVRTGAVSLREIAAITFTEAAAAELRQQIRRAIDAAADDGDDRMVAARDEVDDAAICTLHSFARAHPARALRRRRAPTGIRRARRHRRHGGLRRALDPVRRRSARRSRRRACPGARVLGGTSPHRSRRRGLEPARPLGPARRRRARLPPPGAACDAHWPSTDPGPVIDALDRALDTCGWCTDDDDKMALHLRGTVTDALALLTGGRPDTLEVLQLLDTLPPFRCAHGRQENWTGHVAEVRAACAEAEQIRLDLLDGVRRAVLGDLVARLATFTLAAAEERRMEGRLTFHDLLVHARRLVRAGGDGLAVLRAGATAGCSSTSSRTPTRSRWSWRPGWPPPSTERRRGRCPTRRAVRRG